MPKTHQVTVTMGMTLETLVQVSTVLVTRPEGLAPALAQRDKSIVIENDEMKLRFARLVFWEGFIRWLVFPTLIAWILSQAIAKNYKIDASWHLHWNVGRTFDGKITLTPAGKQPVEHETPEISD
jgi:hypothetical protein